jgi:hypothetical protein
MDCEMDITDICRILLAYPVNTNSAKPNIVSVNTSY